MSGFAGWKLFSDDWVDSETEFDEMVVVGALEEVTCEELVAEELLEVKLCAEEELVKDEEELVSK
jgi:hypothetical protein